MRTLAGVLLLMTGPSPLEDVAHRAPLEFIFGATRRIVRPGAFEPDGPIPNHPHCTSRERSEFYLSRELLKSQ